MLAFVAPDPISLYMPFSLQVTTGRGLPAEPRGHRQVDVTLGLAVGMGGLASPLIGAIADATTLQTALVPLVVMPVLSWLLFLTLTDPEVRVQNPRT